MKAKFIKKTFSSHSSNLNRWECPNCRANKKPECRFNLDQKKINILWKCRFCKKELELIK